MENKRCSSKRKKRARVAGNELEKTLRRRLVKLLRIYEKSHKFIFFHIKNDVGVRSDRFFYDLKPDGVRSGVPDFCFLTERGTDFLELKTSKGKLSDSQKEFRKDAKDLGHRVHVAYGWEDMLEKAKKIIGVNDLY